MPNSKGKQGENFAAEYLKKSGYTILDTNYRQRCGEIDIIAKIGEVIAFVEVKTRGENFLTAPMEAVNYTKRQRIIKTALLYMQNKNLDLQPRFDVFEIITSQSANFEAIKYEHLQSAFDTREYEGFC